mmetsp:Transcript_68526/g.164567  ORF Transcript_68526/g.164567 Transcript_68526/m.164567 type:complete len:355 (-) Transcript_68526:192-1256(-)
MGGGACDPSSSSFFLYNIPCCGGFCAPTVNPEKSCWKQVSNEFTIPASGPFMRLAPLIEFAPCCRCIGKMGFQKLTKHRKTVMSIALFFNVLSLIFAVIAAISGLSKSESIIKALPWVTGEFSDSRGIIKTYLGISSRVDELECVGSLCESRAMNLEGGWEPDGNGVFSRLVEWDDANSCATGVVGSPQDPRILDAGRVVCEECKRNLLASFSLVISIFGQIPTITTNLQRTTVFGDVNCQACWGPGSNLVTFMSSLAALVAFHNACYAELPTDGGTDWKLGISFWLLTMTLVIKIIDSLLHFILPTPEARWEKPTSPLTLEEYLALAKEESYMPGKQDSKTNLPAETVGAAES